MHPFPSAFQAVRKGCFSGIMPRRHVRVCDRSAPKNSPGAQGAGVQTREELCDENKIRSTIPCS